jgi:hypothetical protein
MTQDDSELEDGWLESTEGDLDPDLTEEAGYAWDAPEQSTLLTTTIRIVTFALLLVLVASVVLPAIL